MTKEQQPIISRNDHREALYSRVNGSPNEEAFLLNTFISQDAEENLDPYAKEAKRLQDIKDKTRTANAKASTLTWTGFLFSALNGAFRIADSVKKSSHLRFAPSAAPDRLLHHSETTALVSRGCYGGSSDVRNEVRLDTAFAGNRQDPIAKALTYNSNIFSAISRAYAIPVISMISATLLYRTTSGRKIAQTIAPRLAKWMDEFLASKPDNPSKAFTWANHFKINGFNVIGGGGVVAAGSLKTGDHIESTHRMNKAYEVVSGQESIPKEVAKKYVDAAIPHQTLRETAVFNTAYLGMCLPAAVGGAAGSLYQFSKAYPSIGKRISEATAKKAGDIGGMINGSFFSGWPIVPALIPADITYTAEKNPQLSERHLAEHLNHAWKAINEAAGPELGIVGKVIAASAAFRFIFPKHALSSMFLGKADVMAGGLIIGSGAVIKAVTKDGIVHVTSNWLKDNPLLRTAFYVRSFSAGSRLAMIDSTTEYLVKTGKETPLAEKDAYLRGLAGRTAVAKGLLTQEDLANMSSRELEHYLGTVCYTRKDDKRSEKEKNDYLRKEREIADANLPESRPICPEAYYAREIRSHIQRDRENGTLQKPSANPQAKSSADSFSPPKFASNFSPKFLAYRGSSYEPRPSASWTSFVPRNAPVVPRITPKEENKNSWASTALPTVGAVTRHL